MRGFKLPSDDEIKAIIVNVLNEKTEIPTQKMLSELVKKKLLKKDQQYRVSAARIRRLAFHIKGVKAGFEIKRLERVQKFVRCPACGEVLKKTFARNLLGREIAIERYCSKCGYHTGARRTRIPKRYFFVKI